MPRPGVVLIGAGGHAHACIDVIEEHGGYEILGLLGTKNELGSVHLGYRVIATDDEIDQIAGQCENAVIAVGQIESPGIRIRLYNRAVQCGFKFPVIVSPTAHVSKNAKIGDGTVVLHGGIVNSGVTIGCNCIINSHALVEHDSVIGNHCHIATGAIVNGGVTLGSGTFIGSGSVLKQGLSIGENCIVGMGAAVFKDIPDNMRFPSRLSA